MSETVFFQDAGVTVTNSRFMVNGQMHAMANITSVRRYVQQPNRLWPILMLLVGFFMMASKDSLVMGLIVLAIAAAWLFLQKSVHSVMLSTAAGESQALSDTDSARITNIIDALNNAIVHRG